MAGKPDGYVDVNERIAAFYEKYPEGSLQRDGDVRIMEVGDRLFIVYTALAYRTPDDKRPGVGTAWEPFPGPTPFTKDSELQNAETAAWGRAIASLGFKVHEGIATQQDVQNRNGAPVEGASKQLRGKVDKALPDLCDHAGNAEKVAKKILEDNGGTFPANVGRALVLVHQAWQAVQQPQEAAK